MNKEEIALLQAKYKLTEEEYQKYYRTVNLAFTTGKKKNNESKKLVFVAGQAGAGKSKLIPVVNEELGYNAVISDYDIVRSLHPNFNKACEEVPENVHMALLPDANRANEDLRHYCRDNGINLIYEGTMRGTQVFIDIANEFKEAGYEIDLSLMSVPQLESYGSTLLRYATDIVNNNMPRWVPKQVHDESYEKFIVTLKELSDRKLFDRAAVYRRGTKAEGGRPVEIYSTENRQFHDPIEAILYGREQYRIDAIHEYKTKHDLVCKIFRKKAPNFLPKLKEWEELYEKECREITRQSTDSQIK